MAGEEEGQEEVGGYLCRGEVSGCKHLEEGSGGLLDQGKALPFPLD